MSRQILSKSDRYTQVPGTNENVLQARAKRQSEGRGIVAPLNSD